MSVGQPPSDAPFGLEPNTAAGLAYLVPLVGGILMLAGGGTNRQVKWAAAQSIVIWGLYVGLQAVLDFLSTFVHAVVLVALLASLAWFVMWIWTFVSAFQGKETRVPAIDTMTERVFRAVLG